PGTIVWYRGNPLSNPNAVRLPNAFAAAQQPANNAEYCAQYTDPNTGCFAYSCVTYTVNPLPPLTTPAVDPTSCDGYPFDLTSLESGLSATLGTFVWYEGDPDNGGTQLTTPQATAVQPSPTNLDFCTYFTDNTSSCENKVCVSLNIV